MMTYVARMMRRRRYRDPDTGICNEDFLQRCWSRLVRHARRTRSPLAVVTVVIELDEGSPPLDDAVVKDVGEALQHCDESRDMVVVRSGPTQFTVLVPDVQLSRVGELSELLRNGARRCLARAVESRARVRMWLSVTGGVRARAA